MAVHGPNARMLRDHYVRYDGWLENEDVKLVCDLRFDFLSSFGRVCGRVCRTLIYRCRKENHKITTSVAFCSFRRQKAQIFKSPHRLTGSVQEPVWKRRMWLPNFFFTNVMFGRVKTHACDELPS